MTENDATSDERVHKQRVRLADGRYLIYYTFDEQLSAGDPPETGPPATGTRAADGDVGTPL